MSTGPCPVSVRPDTRAEGAMEESSGGDQARSYYSRPRAAVARRTVQVSNWIPSSDRANLALKSNRISPRRGGENQQQQNQPHYVIRRHGARLALLQSGSNPKFTTRQRPATDLGGGRAARVLPGMLDGCQMEPLSEATLPERFPPICSKLLTRLRLSGFGLERVALGDCKIAG